MSAESDRLALEALRLFVRQVVRDELAAASAPATAPEGFIGTAEAARRWGVIQETVLAAIKGGRLPATRPPGSRDWRIRPADLEAFLAGSKGAAPVSIEAKRAERAARIAAAAKTPSGEGGGKGAGR